MKCVFCGREMQQGDSYITGGVMNMCMCADCFNILHNKYGEATKQYSGDGVKTDSVKIKNVTPAKIKAELDRHIIGQEDAKQDMCTAIYNHYKRINQNDDDDIIIDKSNICLIGPTGTGKTEIARSIAKMLDVPFAICDATSITQSGYVGEDIESIITRVLQNCDYDVKKAEHAIIVIDEADKLRKTSGNTSITRDVSGEGVQQGLLKMLEGTDALVPPQGGRKHPEQKLIKVNTKNILFILSGAFVGLDDIIKKRTEESKQKRTKTMSKIGFNAIYNKYKGQEQAPREEAGDDALAHVEPDDIIRFGMIPEIVGRLPIITHTCPLDAKALRHILTEPVNAITKQYVKLLKYSNVDLSFTDGALDLIANEAEKMGTGARALRTCMEKVMKEPMFNAPELGLSQPEPYRLRIMKNDVSKCLHSCIKSAGDI